MQNAVESYFDAIAPNRDNVTIFVGIHMRMSDYKGYLKGYQITSRLGKTLDNHVMFSKH